MHNIPEQNRRPGSTVLATPRVRARDQEECHDEATGYGCSAHVGGGQMGQPLDSSNATPAISFINVPCADLMRKWGLSGLLQHVDLADITEVSP